MKVLLTAILVLWAPSGYLAQNENCGDTQDAFTLAMSNDPIYESQLVMADLSFGDTGALKVKIDEVVAGDASFSAQLISDDENPDPSAITITGVDADDTKFATLTQSFYYDVCPARSYRLTYWQWFFWYPNKKYCWPINSVWVTSCINRFCKVHPTWELWYYYYRCASEYRLTTLPGVCVTINADGSLTWTSEYLRRYLPIGCCCRRYWRYAVTAELQCPTP